MNQKKSGDSKLKNKPKKNKFYRSLIFPTGVILLYGIIAFFDLSITLKAFYTSGRVLAQITVPLTIAFVMIGLLNWLITPEQTKKFLKQKVRGKGVILAAVSGMISMGPIYAWYPLLASLRKKEMPDFYLATFLGCRAVKIPLLLVMAAYFGWVFTIILSLVLIVNALLTGLIVEIFSH